MLSRSILFIIALLYSSCSDKYVSMVYTTELKDEWSFNETGSTNPKPATVPGLVHADLFRHQLIGNPLFENNEKTLQWIAETDWTYTTTFTADEQLLKYKSVDFYFEGIDTYADVYLNDSMLFRADNMFVPWIADGKRFMVKGVNKLRVDLKSPARTGREKLNAYPHALPAGDPADPKISPFIRKAGYHFGWDWSPRFLTMGIWKPVRMVAHDQVFIRDIHIRTVEIADTCAWLSADVSVISKGDFNNATITLLDTYKNFSIKKGDNNINIRFNIFHPELWWPNGYGNRKLYDITARLFINSYFVDSVMTRTGIRTVELFREEDEFGQAFYFRVNGLPVFIKGANYVPQSNFLTEVQETDYERLIDDAAATGVNMLRVWGGGVYENKTFYERCDEKGILVWQDFMFANAMYPSTSEFMSGALKEVAWQIRRLRNHPSVALWCGNNEMEVAWKNWGWQKEFKITPPDSVKIADEYYYLFERVIPALLGKLDPDRPYVPTSPLSNWGNKNNFLKHNMHYWGVWHGEEAIDSFKVNIPRFMTEYGMQSYPSYASLKKNTDDPRITLNSEFIRNRQRSYKGNGLLLKYIDHSFGQAGNVEDLCYLSQIHQAEAMKIAIESHRMSARFCMGTLYWQLNDVWDGASWSTIEHNGKWKASHYSLKRLYAKDLIVADSDSANIYIGFVTENTAGRSGTVEVTIMDFRGRQTASFARNITTGYLQPEQLTEFSIQSVSGTLSRDEMLIRARFIQGDSVLASTVHYPSKPKDLKLTKPRIQTAVEPTPEGNRITLESDVLAYGVMLEFENAEGHFSDNYFMLLPGEKKTVDFTTKEGTPGDLKIRSYLPARE